MLTCPFGGQPPTDGMSRIFMSSMPLNGQRRTYVLRGRRILATYAGFVVVSVEEADGGIILQFKHFATVPCHRLRRQAPQLHSRKKASYLGSHQDQTSVSEKML